MSYPIGANTWIWVSPVTDDHLARLGPRLRGWGFDFVELPIENLGDWDPARTADLLAELELGASACAVMGEGRSLVADDATVQRTSDYLRASIDAAARAGARVLGGPIYAPVGHTPRLSPSERQTVLERLAAALRPLAEHAAGRGVRLGLEPLNRFETSLVNTVEQACEVVDRVGHPGLGVMLDTFHMNIEERDLPAAVRATGDRLVHVQACANDRGSPGADHLDWTGITAALRDTGYTGAVSIESFTAENQTIATAASIWRPLAPSQDALAVDGLAFLRRTVGR